METGSSKFYWLKLKRDFFKRHDIKIVEAMPNGKDYILFYLKLLLESIDHDGTLRFSDAIPYNEQMLSIVTNTNIDIVKSAMELFIQLNMIQVFDDKTIYMTEVEKLIGSAVDNENANRVRRHRESKKQATLQNVTPAVTKCNESKRIDKEIDIDIEKELDIYTTTTNYTDDELKIENRLVSSGNSMAMLFISKAQLNDLKQKLTTEELSYYLQKMNNMLADDYNFSCSHYNFILKMWKEDRKV